jgi:hypothetical protein
VNCPLCGGALAFLVEKWGRRFFVCGDCDLCSVAPEFLPSPDEELARYREHNNDPADPRYRAHLGRLLTAMRTGLAAGMKGLDFGCGPAPVLAQLFREAGFEMEVYDPFFFPDSSPLTRRYDFIVATETVEHFHHPGGDLDRLSGLLEPGGQLGLMTQMLECWDKFGDWYYPRDPTHVSFYSRRTMQWLAQRFGWSCRFEGKDLTLFRKHPTS